MRIKHYYAFGNEVTCKMKDDGVCSNQIDWELVRKEGGAFFEVDDSREKFIESAENSSDYRKKVEIISDFLDNGVRVCSLGCGKGSFEYLLKAIRPDLYVCCSDYTSDALRKLSIVFTECNEFKTFDMKGSYDEMKSFDCLIMHRVSTEFSFREWNEIFRRCKESDIDQIIFIPTEILKITDVLRELLLCVRWKIKRQQLTFSGWMYSKNELIKMWDNYYQSKFIKFDDGNGMFYLTFGNE